MSQDSLIGSVDGFELISGGTPGPGADFWYQPTYQSAGRIGPITPDVALTISTVYCCIKILAETVASLPWQVFQRTDDGRQLAENHRLYHVLNRRPNREQTSFEFREMMQGHFALRGRAFAEIISGRRGFVDELIPLHPGSVEEVRLPDGALAYEVAEEDGSKRRVPWGRMFALQLPGGRSPVEILRRSIAEAAEQERQALDQATNDSRPNGVLASDKPMKEEERNQLRREWEAVHAGRRRTAVLSHGLDWKQVGLSNEDQQFLSSRRFKRGEIAAIWRIPLNFINELERATHSNSENMSADFIKFTMIPWFERWEQAADRDLFEEDEPFYNQFDFNGLLRADRKTRSESNKTEFMYGVRSVNEWRKVEGLYPIADGDRHFIAANLIPLEMAGENIQRQGGGAPIDEEGGNPPLPPPGTYQGRAATATKSLEPLIQDAADRIASNRSTLVATRIGKAKDGRARFDAWLIREAGPKLESYAGKVLAPLLAVACPGSDASLLAGQVTDSFVSGLIRAGDPAKRLDADSAESVAAAIRAALKTS